jgi:hypothetical protein
MPTALLGYQLPAAMIDTVNDSPLWGFPARTIKLSAAPWEAKYWGSCAVYYQRTLEFDIRFRIMEDGTIETWDRFLQDEGTKVLYGQWGVVSGATVWQLLNLPGTINTGDSRNPLHFIKVPDLNGNHLGKIPLNGRGMPAGVLTPTTNVFVSLVNGNNHPLNNAFYWLPVVGAPRMDPTSGQANQPKTEGWEDDIELALGQFGPLFQDATIQKPYKAGQIVNTDNLPGVGSNWIALFPNHGDRPDISTTGNWTSMPRVFNGKGPWSSSTTYAQGDLVVDFVNTGSVGSLFITKYPESNFLLLGIPTTF